MAFQYAGRYGPEAVTDKFGDAQLGASIQVLDSTGTTPATIYLDATRTTQATNPVLSDASTGNLTFYADPGDYQLLTPAGLIPVTVPMDPRDLPAHTAAIDPHGDRADASSKFVPLTQRGAVNGVATLDGTGKIPTTQMPLVAIGDTFLVASQVAMLALTAQRGDVAVRTDLLPAETFMLAADDPTQLVNWVQITTPGAVVSVNGHTGAVALVASDVGADSSGAAIAALAAATGRAVAFALVLGG